MSTKRTTTETAPHPRQALRPKEAAAALGISERTLWEWTRDAYGPYTGDAGSFALNPTVPGTADSTRAMRGGSWYSTMPINVRATNRNLSAPATRYSYIGFRCAHSPL